VRGYFGIGIENAKTEANIGTLWRSAYCFGASFIFTIGGRYKEQASDTTKAWRHIPLYEYFSLESFIDARPRGSTLVGVEVGNSLTRLPAYQHPTSALYVLGPEDGSLSIPLMEWCNDLITIDSKYCLNVAVAGSIVMYDRQSKS
jgi:tRNA G18 (ribose-2'-O)-methylase SpoU